MLLSFQLTNEESEAKSEVKSSVQDLGMKTADAEAKHLTAEPKPTLSLLHRSLPRTGKLLSASELLQHWHPIGVLVLVPAAVLPLSPS